MSKDFECCPSVRWGKKRDRCFFVTSFWRPTINAYAQLRDKCEKLAVFGKKSSRNLEWWMVILQLPFALISVTQTVMLDIAVYLCWFPTVPDGCSAFHSINVRRIFTQHIVAFTLLHPPTHANSSSFFLAGHKKHALQGPRRIFEGMNRPKTCLKKEKTNECFYRRIRIEWAKKRTKKQNRRRFLYPQQQTCSRPVWPRTMQVEEEALLERLENHCRCVFTWKSLKKSSRMKVAR